VKDSDGRRGASAFLSLSLSLSDGRRGASHFREHLLGFSLSLSLSLSLGWTQRGEWPTDQRGEMAGLSGGVGLRDHMVAIAAGIQAEFASSV
jgi:hypothetical protein